MDEWTVRQIDKQTNKQTEKYGQTTRQDNLYTEKMDRWTDILTVRQKNYQNDNMAER